MSSFDSVLTPEDIEYIFSLPEVQAAKTKIDGVSEGKIYFKIALTDSIRAALQSRFGLTFEGISELPMRWIKGDTTPHIDRAVSAFENTYIVYLNDSPGEFLVGDASYPIAQNTGYVFSEGVPHSTAHTGGEPRLLLGPMNELAEPVGGGIVVYYYASQADASGEINNIFNSFTYEVLSGGTSATHWIIDHNVPGGVGPTTGVVYNGEFLIASGVYHLYPVVIRYYTNQGNADYPNTVDPYLPLPVAFGGSYTIGNDLHNVLSSITGSWRISSVSSIGASNPAVVYPMGSTLLGDGETTGFYNLYPAAPCFLEGSQILCQVDGVERYLPIESLRPGTLVKTSRDGFKRVELIGRGEIVNSGTTDRIETRLYKCDKTAYPELTEDLYITGGHGILVSTLTDAQRAKTIELVGDTYVTDRKYRLMACVDERAIPWASEGTYPIWQFALECPNEGMNYGVYANGGLLVESCSLRFMKQKANMVLM